FLVAYSLHSGPRVQTVVNPPIVAAPGASGATYIAPLPAASTTIYTEEALRLDFVDARSGRVFWRGYASYVIDTPAAVSTQKTEQAVEKIMRKYPAPQLAS